MPAHQDFEKLTDDFTRSVLAFSPAAATQAGYHDHNGMALDEAIDDFSPAGIDAQRRFYQDTQKRLAALDVASLDRGQQADLEILRNNVGGALLELDTIQSYRHNPTVYVELAGNALYTPFVLNYAPLDARFRHIIRRLEKIPALVDQAKANLVDAPEVWNRVAREENDGNIGLIDHTLRQAAPDALKSSYDAAAGPGDRGAEGLERVPRRTRSRRRRATGGSARRNYARKFAYVLATDATPEQLLADAERDLQATRMEMATLAAPRTVKQALDEIAHASRHAGHLHGRGAQDAGAGHDVRPREAAGDAAAAVEPAGDRHAGVHARDLWRRRIQLGACRCSRNSAPSTGSRRFRTTWPKARIESKLREYNELRPAGADDPRSDAGALRAAGVGQRSAAQVATRAAQRVRQHALRRGLGASMRSS